ncbi:hypothetical protein GS528_16550 [Rhodococcus hoagii]|nr:hypothetical protein [Prescottella equi]
MASKGARTRVVTRVPDEVAEALEEGRKNAGVESLSQYVADLLAYCTGNAALARELSPNQEKLMSQEVSDVCVEEPITTYTSQTEREKPPAMRG